MKARQVFLSLLIWVIVFSANSAFAQSTSDTLTFVHTKTEQKVMLTKGMLIEVKTDDNRKFVGEFVMSVDDHIQIKLSKTVENLPVADLKKIIVYREGSKDPITGTVRLVVSASSATSMILGAGAMAGGIATVSNNKVLGIGLIGASIPLIYYGIKLHFMLKNADRDVIKMNKGWEVSTSKR